jgi:hypothetical protein
MKPPWHHSLHKRDRNNRGGLALARRVALQDISQHQFETAPELPWLGPRNCEVGYYCWTAKQLSKDRMITYLNRQLGL